jgi:hypothetical protein
MRIVAPSSPFAGADAMKTKSSSARPGTTAHSSCPAIPVTKITKKHTTHTIKTHYHTIILPRNTRVTHAISETCNFFYCNPHQKNPFFRSSPSFTARAPQVQARRSRSALACGGKPSAPARQAVVPASLCSRRAPPSRCGRSSERGQPCPPRAVRPPHPRSLASLPAARQPFCWNLRHRPLTC